MVFASMSSMQRLPKCAQIIEVGSCRTFQQPASEPLGEAWQTELSSLLGVQEASAAAIQRGQTNGDPGVAEARAALAFIQRTLLSLPEGQARDELRDGIQHLRSKAEQHAQEAKLRPTQARAGKQERRRNGRPEHQRLVTALQQHRTNKRSSVPLVQQQQVEQAQGSSDAFPKLARKGKATNKVRTGNLAISCGDTPARLATGLLLQLFTTSQTCAPCSHCLL